MELTVNSAPGQPGVSIIALTGDLDASNYREVIQRVGELHRAGTRALIFDLTKTGFVSSSGVFAIHSMALILQGEQAPNPEDGWGAIHTMQGGPGSRARESLKLVNPAPRVAATLEKVGFSESLDVYPTVEAALAAL